MRRDGREPGNASDRAQREERRRQQFQDRSIGAPPLTNIPPQRQQQQQTQPSYADRFSGQRGGANGGGSREPANVARAPAIAPEAAPPQQPHRGGNTDNFRLRRQDSGGQNIGDGGGNGGGGEGRGRGRRGAPAEASN
jgi:hypothetical protein